MNSNKFNIVLFFLLLSISATSQINEKVYHNQIRLNYLSISMPEKRFGFKASEMGLGGAHYQLPINDFLYVSGGMYFALHGDQGGLFTLGAGLGFNYPILKNIYLDGNVHFGGGGGYRVLINDGAYLNTNIGLAYKKRDYAIGVQYSYFNFLSGTVKDNTVSFYVQIPNVIHSIAYKNANQIVDATKLSNTFNKKTSKSAVIVRFDFFNPVGNSKSDSRKSITDKKLYVLGFEYQKYLNSNAFLFVHTDAIYKGLRSGFMDLFFGGGFHPIITKYLDITTKLAIGSAGGRILAEGGLTIYPSIGIDLKPLKNVSLSTHLGYLRYIDGTFEAKTYGFGLKYNMESAGKTSFDGTTKIDRLKTIGLRFSLQNQIYLNVPKTDDLEGKLITDLQSLAVNIGYDFNKYLYGFGEASFTYEGRSGGYAHGMFGLGGKSPNFLNEKLRVFLEIGLGVAGGGGIDAKEGIVIRPNIGLSYDLNDQFSILASGGKFLTPDNTINSTNFNVGVSFNIASLLTK